MLTESLAQPSYIKWGQQIVAAWALGRAELSEAGQNQPLLRGTSSPGGSLFVELKRLVGGSLVVHRDHADVTAQGDRLFVWNRGRFVSAKKVPHRGVCWPFSEKAERC